LKDKSVTTFPEEGSIPKNSQRFAHFTKLGDWLWMTPLETDSPYIFQVSPTTGLIQEKIRLGNRLLDTAVQITQDGQYLWAALRSGKIVKIDPAALEVVKAIPTDAANLIDIFVSSGFVWAVDEQDAQIFQVDPKNDELVSSYSTGSIPPPSATPTITETPDPNLIWALCADAYQTQLQVGDRARVNDDPAIPNRIRQEPGGDNPILGYIQPGEVVEVLNGPVCMGQWVWWKVTSLSTQLTGWTSEGNGVDYWLLPLGR
jgi:hypothetical protein